MEERHSGGNESWIVSNSAILAHGIGMVFAWPLFIGLGAITGRYFKPPNNRKCHLSVQVNNTPSILLYYEYVFYDLDIRYYV